MTPETVTIVQAHDLDHEVQHRIHWISIQFKAHQFNRQQMIGMQLIGIQMQQRQRNMIINLRIQTIIIHIHLTICTYQTISNQ